MTTEETEENDWQNSLMGSLAPSWKLPHSPSSLSQGNLGGIALPRRSALDLFSSDLRKWGEYPVPLPLRLKVGSETAPIAEKIAATPFSFFFPLEISESCIVRWRSGGW